MLLIKTKIGPSAIAGIGLFADEFIPKGTSIWKFQKGFDLRVNEHYFNALPEPAKTFFQTYAYQNPVTHNYVMCADNARFFNHSDVPNTLCVENPDDEDTDNIATRDILAGEEITIDYREFDKDPFYGFTAKQ